MSLFSIFRYREKKSPDKLGLYPERFHIKSFPERRYLWTSRILVIISVLSCCITIMLTAIVYVLLPQKNTFPSLFRVNPYSYELEKIQSNRTTVPFRDMLTEKYITEYIKLRHSIPKSTADLFYRWDTNSLFYWYSGLRNYYSYVNNLDNDQLKSFIRMKMKRQVDVKQIKKLSNNLWMAEFETATTTKDLTEPDVIIWRAYMRITYLEFDKYEDIEKDEEEKLNYTSNPFGFKVMSYSLSYKGKPQKADTAIQTAKKIFENLEDVVK